jgi:hypothetical protein
LQAVCIAAIALLKEGATKEQEEGRREAEVRL